MTMIKQLWLLNDLFFQYLILLSGLQIRSGNKDGWLAILCSFEQYLYQDDGRITTKDCVQWNPVQTEKISTFQNQTQDS